MLLEVSDPSHVAFVRRQASTLSQDNGLDEDAVGRVALIVTEIATNLLKHGRDAKLVLNTFSDGSGAGIEIIALDAGVGIADIPRALTDGYSTSGTSGNGLGIIQRQSELMTMFSRPEKGTVLVARIVGDKTKLTSGLVVGAISDPYPGEKICGDSWAHFDGPNPTLILADGSGHGIAAEFAAQTAINIVAENRDEDCVRIMELIHKAMFATRGAAVAVARIDTAAKVVRYVGVGNIVGATFSGADAKRMVSNNGTAGTLSPRIREFTYPYEGQPTVVLHSDGLTAKWNPDDYPGLMTAHPSIIAGLLFRDFRRGRDDATVVAMRSSPT